MKKKFISRVLAGALAASMLMTGCSKTETKVAESQVATNETKTEEKNKLPMNPTVMKPWINTCILGEVTDEVNAELKDDFFLNVNHDWLRDAKLRPGYDSETPIIEAVDIVKNRCLEFLTDKTLKFDDPVYSHDVELIQGYYDLFLDWEGRNKVGVEPLKPIVEKIKAISNLDELSEFLLSEEARENGLGLFGVKVSIDSQDSSSYGVEVSSTDLSLEDADEYNTLTENGKRVKKAVDDKTLYMLDRIGIDESEAKALIESSFDLETKISKSMMGLLEAMDPDSLMKTINQVTTKDVKDMEGKLPIAEYMDKYGYSVSKLINLQEPNWLKGLAEIYSDENIDGMKAYLLTSIARDYINKTDEPAFRKYQEINNAQKGITESQPDTDLAYLEAKKIMSPSFARIYVKKYVTPEMKQEITEFCQESIDAYREMLQGIEWMTDETKKAAINKLDHIKIHSLYPDKWEDDSVFQFASKENGGTYFDAQKALIKGVIARQMSRINGKVDNDIWQIDILETNAFYAAFENSVNIIPGYLCDVTYRSDMSIEEKYGAIGSVIGHEISHAFDTNGSQYDEVGNVKDWWAKEDKDAFRERASKLVAYYDNVVAFDDGTKYSGQMVQTEAIADIAGLKVMLTLAKKVPNFDYDKFFRAFERMWARVYTIESAENATLTDTHPLHYLRGNVTVQQFDEFLETYGIKEGDGMYLAPEDRISVW